MSLQHRPTSSSALRFARFCGLSCARSSFIMAPARVSKRARLRACVRACVRACMSARVRVHACARVRVRACVRACIRACVCACVHACVRACTFGACAHAWGVGIRRTPENVSPTTNRATVVRVPKAARRHGDCEVCCRMYVHIRAGLCGQALGSGAQAGIEIVWWLWHGSGVSQEEELTRREAYA